MPEGSLSAEWRRAILRHVTGGTNWALPFVLAIGFTVNLVSAAIYEAWRTTAGWAAFALLVAVLAILFALAQQANDQLTTVMVKAATLPHCKALVLFLSPKPKPEVLEQWLADSRFSGGLTNEAVREVMGTWPWRMPVRGIAEHAAYLDFLVIIPSADSKDRKGTWRDLPDFRRLLDVLMEGRSAKPDIQALPDVTGKWREGVDFEDADELAAAVRAVFAGLREKRLREADILLDITGGSKVASVVGAVFSLGRDQIFQYVSQHNYEVIPYNVTYVPER